MRDRAASTIGPSIGDLIEAAGVVPDTLPTGQDLMLVGCWADNMEEGKRTLLATNYQHGVLVAATPPRAGSTHQRGELDRQLRAYRWVFHPCYVRRKHGAPGQTLREGQRNVSGELMEYAISPGSVMPCRRFLMVCPECGDQQVVYLRRLKREDKRLRKQHPEFMAGFPKERAQMACGPCQSQLGELILRQSKPLWTCVYGNGDAADPAFTDRSDPQVTRLYEEWCNPTYSMDATVLPRVWAAFAEGKAPTDNIPMDDDEMQQLEFRAERQGLTVRAFSEACKLGRGLLRYLWLETSCKQEMRIGWVPRSWLTGMGDELGFNRQFIRERKTRQSVTV